METPIQQLIKHIQNNATKFSLMNTSNILKEIEPYLQKEKEHIVQAYQISGINNYDNKKFPNITPEYFQICGNEYFDKHYNQNNE